MEGESQKTANGTRHEIEAIDREIAFYRRRAGQVFFISLSVEVFILAGREKIVVPGVEPWIQPLSYGPMFIAVAAFGILLGREYRSRIHLLKSERRKRSNFDPPSGGYTLSEIEMLYVVLVFLSSSGLVLVWLNGLTGDDHKSWAVSRLSLTFWALFVFFVLTGLAGMGWVFWKAWPWLRGKTSSSMADTKTQHDRCSSPAVSRQPKHRRQRHE